MWSGAGMVTGGAMLAVGSPHDVSRADGGVGWTISAPAGKTLVALTTAGLSENADPQAPNRIEEMARRNTVVDVRST